IAPMLGLLGTVVGMVGAFDAITMAEGPARPDQLAGSISTALITTVLGLIVAIPCTSAYTYLRNRIDHLTTESNELIDELIAPLGEAGAQQGQRGCGVGQARWGVRAPPAGRSAPDRRRGVPARRLLHAHVAPGRSAPDGDRPPGRGGDGATRGPAGGDDQRH